TMVQVTRLNLPRTSRSVKQIRPPRSANRKPETGSKKQKRATPTPPSPAGRATVPLGRTGEGMLLLFPVSGFLRRVVEPSDDEFRWEPYDGAMGFGHIYVKADPQPVAALIGRHLAEKGFEPMTMTPELHPKRMKEMHENQMRLYWVSPRLQ